MNFRHQEVHSENSSTLLSPFPVTMSSAVTHSTICTDFFVLYSLLHIFFFFLFSFSCINDVDLNGLGCRPSKFIKYRDCFRKTCIKKSLDAPNKKEA